MHSLKVLLSNNQDFKCEHQVIVLVKQTYVAAPMRKLCIIAVLV